MRETSGHDPTRDLASRLREISDAISRVASGDFEVDLPSTPGMDEVDAIARGVSMLAEEIGERVRDLEHYRDLVENQEVGISMVDGEESFVFANRAAHLIFGVPEGSLTGRNLREFLDEPALRQVLEQTKLRRLGEKSTYELEIIRPDVARRILRVSSTPRHDQRGAYTGALGIFSDVTDQRRWEESEKRHLREMAFLSEAAIAFVQLSPEEDIYRLIGRFLKVLAEDSYVFIVSYDDAAETVRPRAILGETDVIEKAMRAIGWDPLKTEFPVPPVLRDRFFGAGLVKMTDDVYKLLFPELPEEAWGSFAETYGFGDVYVMAIKRRDVILGGVMIVLPKDRVLENPDLVEAYIYQSAVALQHRLAEEALRESESKLRRITDTSQDIISQIDLEGVYLYISPSCRSILGFEPEEMLGRSIFELIHHDDLPGVASELAAARRETRPSRMEYRCRHADGHYVWLETFGNPLLDDRGKTLGAIFSARDVTMRKHALEALRESDKRYRSVTESAIDAIITCDSEGFITSWNKGAESIFGYADREVLGRSIRLLIPQQRIDEYTGKLRQSIADLGPEAFSRQAEAYGLRKGGEEFPLEISATSWKAGESFFYTGIIRDITERKGRESEIERMNQELKAYDHTVSHDLKGPLATVKVAVEYLKSELAPDVPGHDAVSKVIEAIDNNITKVTGILDDLLGMAEVGDRARDAEEIEITEVVREVISEAEGAGNHADFRINDLGKVRANRVHVYQLFSNLMRNAVEHVDDAFPEVSVLRIADHRYLVRDNGSGVPDYLLSTLFLPFVRGEDGGRGLGLSIVKRIVDTYGGEIRVYNDGGACFEFSLYDFETREEER